MNNASLSNSKSIKQNPFQYKVYNDRPKIISRSNNAVSYSRPISLMNNQPPSPYTTNNYQVIRKYPQDNHQKATRIIQHSSIPQKVNGFKSNYTSSLNNVIPVKQNEYVHYNPQNRVNYSSKINSQINHIKVPYESNNNTYNLKNSKVNNIYHHPNTISSSQYPVTKNTTINGRNNPRFYGQQNNIYSSINNSKKTIIQNLIKKDINSNMNNFKISNVKVNENLPKKYIKSPISNKKFSYSAQKAINFKPSLVQNNSSIYKPNHVIIKSPIKKHQVKSIKISSNSTSRIFRKTNGSQFNTDQLSISKNKNLKEMKMNEYNFPVIVPYNQESEGSLNSVFVRKDSKSKNINSSSSFLKKDIPTRNKFGLEKKSYTMTKDFKDNLRKSKIIQIEDLENVTKMQSKELHDKNTSISSQKKVLKNKSEVSDIKIEKKIPLYKEKISGITSSTVEKLVQPEKPKSINIFHQIKSEGNSDISESSNSEDEEIETTQINEMNKDAKYAYDELDDDDEKNQTVKTIENHSKNKINLIIQKKESKKFKNENNDTVELSKNPEKINIVKIKDIKENTPKINEVNENKEEESFFILNKTNYNLSDLKNFEDLSIIENNLNNTMNDSIIHDMFSIKNKF